MSYFEAEQAAMANGRRSQLLQRFVHRRTLFLICDIQEKLEHRIPGFHSHIEVTNSLTLFCEMLGPRFASCAATVQYPEGVGPIFGGIKLPPNTPVFPKLAPSMLVPEMLPYLYGDEEKGLLPVQQVILWGHETHVCVMNTANELVRRGFAVGIAVDACASQSPLDHETALQEMGKWKGVFLSTSISLLTQLVRAHPFLLKLAMKLLLKRTDDLPRPFIQTYENAPEITEAERARYVIPVERPLSPHTYLMRKFTERRTLFLCCDIQTKVEPHIANFFDAVHVSNLMSQIHQLFSELAVADGVPSYSTFLVTEQYPQGVGPVHKDIKLPPDAKIFSKMKPSMLNKETVPYLFGDPEKGIPACEQAVLWGHETYGCIVQTADALLERGIPVAVLVDGCSSQRKEDHDVAVLEMSHWEGLTLSTAASTLMQLTQSEPRTVKRIIAAMKEFSAAMAASRTKASAAA